MIPSLDFARNARNTREASTWHEHRKITPLFDSVSKHALPTFDAPRDLIPRALHDTIFELVPCSRLVWSRVRAYARRALSQETIS